MLNIELDDGQLASWREHHHLILRAPFLAEQILAIRQWTETLEGWPETPAKWMKYFEEDAVTGIRRLCRVENFVQFHDGMHDLLRGAGAMAILEQLMGEPAVLFKEKINFKHPGGAGFTAHQDAPAFGTFGHDYHITMSIAVDDADVENGCLEMSDAVETYRMLEQADDGTVAPAREALLSWRPVELQAGDVVFFDSYIPHRSKANCSNRPRRAFFATYNRLEEGDVRDAYFAHKRSVFPPECERQPGVDYSDAGPYNLGNPIR
jgi:hypothetical protein